MKLLLTIVAVAIIGISGLLLFNDVAEAAPHCKVDKTPTWRVAHTRLDGNQANHNLMNYSWPAAQCLGQRLQRGGYVGETRRQRRRHSYMALCIQFISAPHERRYGEGLHQALRLSLMAFQRDMGQLVRDGLSRDVSELRRKTC